jgi:iron complex outermembrane recepter protein
MKRIILCVVACLLLPILLFAQTQIKKTKQQSRKDTLVHQVGLVTVTATRQQETNLEVPLAVTVVPKEQFANNRGYGLDEALSLVPGALVQSRSGNQDVRVTIRGFGARGAGQRSNAGTSRGVRFYMDGIPETEPDGRTAFDLIDLSGASSIEVIRSNASALWGNASGGIVNISTIPTEDYAFVNAQNSIGSFGFSKQSIQASSPLGNGGKIYTSINNTNFAGWRDQSNSTLFQFNTGIVTKLGERTKLNVFLIGASNLFRIPGPLTQSQFDSMPTQAQTLTGYQFNIRDERRFNRIGRIGTTFEHQFEDGGTVSAVGFIQSKFLQRSERGQFRDFNRYHVGGNVVYRKNIVLSDDIRLQVLGGVDNQYQDGAIQFYKLTDGNRGDSLRTNKREGANNFGAFLQTELNISNTLTAMVGARLDRISYYNEDFAAGVRLSNKSETKVWQQVTPKFGLNYRLSSTMSVYANVGGGVEVPAGNEVDPVNTPNSPLITTGLVNSALNNPIRSFTYEVGSKAIIDVDQYGILRDFSYDIAFYNVSVTNDLVPYQGGVFYLPVGESRRLGAEIGTALRFDYGLTLFATATISRNTYANYRVDSIYTKSTFDSSLVGKSADFSNNKMAGVPDVFATARLRWNPTFFRQAFIEWEYRMVGSYFADDANKVNVTSYNVMDANIGIDQPLFDNLSFRAMARINNIADQKYMASVWINPDRISGQPAFIEPGLPRNYAVNIGLRYNFQ